MFELAKVGAFLVSPLTVTFVLAAISLLLALARRKRLAVGLSCMALVLLWLASTPAIGVLLAGPLEAKFPAIAVDAAPQADAILVLGGGLTGARPPRRPEFTLGAAADRVWHAAALYRAGKARWVIVAAGNQPDRLDQQTEADAIAEMLTILGVPRTAQRLEDSSRNTHENALNTRAIAEELEARRVLLVTSAAHMPRALGIFRKVWGPGVTFTAASADVGVDRLDFSPKMWIPSASALAFVTKTIKEYAGAIAVTMM